MNRRETTTKIRKTKMGSRDKMTRKIRMVTRRRNKDKGRTIRARRMRKPKQSLHQYRGY